MDRATELITHVEVKAGKSADGEHLAGKMTEAEQAVNVEIARMTGDTAHGRPAMRERGTAVLAPVTAPDNRGLLTKDGFRLDLTTRTCICSFGKQGRPTLRQDGSLAEFRVAAKTCANCRLRAQCTTSKREGRTVAVRPDEAEYLVLRAQQKTEAWQADYLVRPRIEHKLSELVSYGMRQARHIGLAKTQLPLMFTATVVNLQRLGVLPQGGSLSMPA